MEWKKLNYEKPIPSSVHSQYISHLEHDWNRNCLLSKWWNSEISQNMLFQKAQLTWNQRCEKYLDEWDLSPKNLTFQIYFLRMKQNSNAVNVPDIIKRPFLNKVIVLTKDKSCQSYYLYIVLLFPPNSERKGREKGSQGKKQKWWMLLFCREANGWGRAPLLYTSHLQKSHESSKHRGFDKLFICAGKAFLVGAEHRTLINLRGP